jgi:hypothetical protein
VRRRVSQAVGGLAAALAITVVGYWTWLDQHYFFRLEGNHVTLYHGYSNFPWPGMPQRLWQFSIYQALIDSESKLAKGGEVIFAKDQDTSRIFAWLEPSLTTTGKVYLASQGGQREKARQLAKTALDANDPTVKAAEMLGFYALLSTPSDDNKALFASVIQNDKIGASASIAFPALLQIDPDRAVELIKDAPTSLNPDVLLGVRILQPPCSQKIRSYLFYHLIQSEQLDLAEFGMNAVLQAQCKESALLFFAEDHPRGRRRLAISACSSRTPIVAISRPGC